MLKISLAISALILLFSACAKPPTYDNVPEISFVRFSSDTVQQATGICSFVISFTDGDGDLGSNENGVVNCFIIDNRRNDTIPYTIPEIPKQGVADAIAGEIEIDVAQICCINPDIPIACSPIANTYQQSTYSFIIKDRAGNFSNKAQSTALNIKCFE
jgi:hypothetical protein